MNRPNNGTAQDRHRPWRLPASAILLTIAWTSVCSAADWQSTLTKNPPGNFPALRPLRATYRFGWSGFTAAIGEVHFTKPSASHFQVDGNGHTIGLVRVLWRLDTTHHALADAATLRPIEMRQVEVYWKKTLVTHLAFTDNGVRRSRTESPGRDKISTKEFQLPNMFDLNSAALYLRSQPLKEGSVYRVVVYPATTPYLATLTVTGREKVAVHAGVYNAIKIDLHLDKIGKNLELEPHKKFRRATLWVSDDSDRLLLRAEAQIFVGTVFADLQSIQFEEPKS
jgi:hypothetical protein